MSDDSRFAERFLAWSRVAAAIAVATGVLVMYGWAFDVAQIKSVVPGLVTMKPLTAACFILCGASLWLRARTGNESERPGAPRARRLAVAAALCAALAGGATLAEYVFAADFGIDTLLFAEAVRADAGPFPGRMAIATALTFVLVGGALAAADAGNRGWRVVSDYLAPAALVIATIAIAGYLYGVSSLYSIAAYSSMALHTALLLALLAAGTVLARPGRGLGRLLATSGGGGIMARRMLPVAIVAPLLVGWLRWQGEKAGLYDTAFGVALFAVALIMMLSAVVLFVAWHLRRYEAARLRSARLVRVQANGLERIALGLPLEQTLSGLLLDVEAMDPGMLTSVLLLSEDGTRLRHGAAPRLPAAYIAAIDGVAIGPATGSCGTAAWRREQVVVSDIAADPLWENFRGLAAEHGLAACWSTPIFGAGKELLGTFAIYYRQPKAPDPSDRSVIEAITHFAAVAIDRSRATEALVMGNAALEAAQERGQIGSWELDVGATRGRWSREMSRIFGRAPESPAPTLDELLELVHPEDRRSLAGILAHPETLRAQRRMDFRLLLANSKVRYLSGTVDLVRDGQGKPMKMAGTVLDITARKLAELEVQNALTRVRELSRRLAEAEEEERRNISRELHDSFGADLAAVKLNLDLIGAALGTATPAPVATRLADTRTLVQGAIDHSRLILSELRPPGLDDYGLRAALEMHAESVENRLGIPVSVSGCSIDPPLPRLVETALFRIVQEALNNIAKHAHADSADIVLEQIPAGLRLTVADDGGGFDVARAVRLGYGFRTMRERAEAVGARFDIRSKPGRGTRITIEVERAGWA